ncbi:hypothetical protein GF336_07705 [Candidatus Woesearchaeota archaeon]|nr:hypothetical protein [Candidatus Woesearchaeota archaeon]
MHIRKLVKSGTASHTISLPKDWISKNKLKKGDLLYIDEQDNDLKISTKNKDATVKQKEKIINIDREVNSIRRDTISAYINNHTDFVFTGNTLNEKLEDIRNVLQNFLALEVIEQTEKRLIAKDFLNIKEFSLEKTARRMDMLTRSMIEDAKKGKEQYQTLYFRDFEVDKLFFLMSRLIRKHLSDPASSISPIKAHTTWWLAKNLESAADAAKNLSRIFSKEIKGVYEGSEEYYRECIKSYFTKDKDLANRLIEKRLELLERCDKIKGEQRYLIKELINSSRNIAKVILDSQTE